MTGAWVAAMNRGAVVVRPFAAIGRGLGRTGSAEHGSSPKLWQATTTTRDQPGWHRRNLGPVAKISPLVKSRRTNAGMPALRARHRRSKPAPRTFLRELVWREFAYHLMYHTPHMLTDNWRTEWSAFPWREDADASDVLAWKQGRTGEPFVDAAMREMYVTGRMHNRARMIAASYLTKHLMVHWRIGMEWFEECLTDWDPASNAMGWQWTAGSGPDASPYFRIFNPATQLEKFDPDGDYVARWIAEGRSAPSRTALAYFDAVPKSWQISAKEAYPQPLVDLSDGRKRALAAYEARNF